MARQMHHGEEGCERVTTREYERGAVMGLLLFILLLLLLVGGLPTWSYSRSWGYAPSGLLSLLLIVLILLMVFEVVPWGFGPATPRY
jgi:hypothetical protein